MDLSSRSEGLPLEIGGGEIRQHPEDRRGIQEFIRIYHETKGNTTDELTWAERIEYTLVHFDEAAQRAQLLLHGHQLLPQLQQKEHEAIEKAGNGEKTQLESLWRPAYADYMVAGTPGQPHAGSDLVCLHHLEKKLRDRRLEAQQLLDANSSIITFTAFPRLGCPDFTFPAAKTDPVDGVSRSLFFPDEAIFPGHPRFKTLTRNIRQRRGKKVAINVPVFVDKNTPRPFVEDYVPLGDDGEAKIAAKPDHIYMDDMGFGMGCCCLQLSVSAAAPIFRGQMADADCRWNVISGSVDDRTEEERTEEPLEGGGFCIAKSRYGSVASYISPRGEKYNDMEVVVDEDLLQEMVDSGIDRPLALHVLRSANWQTIRFRPPLSNCPPNSPMGWCVEFCPMETQMTDFENSAFVGFMVLLTRVIESFDLNFLIPMSKVEENMKEAKTRDAARQGMFYFRKDIVTGSIEPPSYKKCAKPFKDEYMKMTVNQIFNGIPDVFPGLIPLIKDYLKGVKLDGETSCTLQTYLRFMRKKASGELQTTARWLRDFVLHHSEYAFNSGISEKINYDLMRAIAKGNLMHPRLRVTRVRTPGVDEYYEEFQIPNQCLVLCHLVEDEQAEGTGNDLYAIIWHWIKGGDTGHLAFIVTTQFRCNQLSSEKVDTGLTVLIVRDGQLVRLPVILHEGKQSKTKSKPSFVDLPGERSKALCQLLERTKDEVLRKALVDAKREKVLLVSSMGLYVMLLYWYPESGQVVLLYPDPLDPFRVRKTALVKDLDFKRPYHHRLLWHYLLLPYVRQVLDKLFAELEMEAVNLAIPRMADVRRYQEMLETWDSVLRTDIPCGSMVCRTCPRGAQYHKLEAQPNLAMSSQFPNAHHIIPTLQVVVNHMAFLERPDIKNIIIMSTVAEEVERNHSSLYERLEKLDAKPSKHIFCFANELHRECFVEQIAGESKEERDLRAVGVAARWHTEHLRSQQQAENGTAAPVALLLASEPKELPMLAASGAPVFLVDDYVAFLTASDPVVNLLPKPPTLEEEKEMTFFYPPHLKSSIIQSGLTAGTYHKGKYQASRENHLEATVSVEGRDQLVLLQGRVHLNRAVNDDIVAIEIFTEDKWSCPSNLVLEREVLEDEDEVEKDKTAKKLEDEMEKLKRAVSKKDRQPTGRVVGIIKRNWGTYCGVLRPKMSQTPSCYVFVPEDNRIPWVLVNGQQGAALQGQRIVVAVKSWPCSSKIPIGHYVRKLGAVGDKAAENEVLLREHGIQHDRFSDAVIACLPTLPWILTDEEVAKRTDLRHLDICSVDPPGCTDINDALHLRALDNGNLEVGVHIADVTHFVRPNNAMDKEAASRATTVYLVDKRIGILPDLLSFDLCSLRSGEDRLAFSCIWEMTTDARIVSEQFTKTVIRSRAALTYEQAQMRIDDENLQDTVTLGLRGLNKLSKIMRARRIESGAIFLTVPFNTDNEMHDPINVQSEVFKETNWMVEEFMLLANITVAEKIYKEFPENALLRRQPAPPLANYEPIVRAAKSKKLTLQASSGKALSDSLERAYLPGQPYFNTMLRILTTRCMMQAVYFCSGSLQAFDEFQHYGLATPIYTHFTSPIRRYADVMVHRLLAAAIRQDATYPALLDKAAINKLCQNINYRHRMAQYASRASVALHTQWLFYNRLVDEEAYVLQVRRNAVQVLVPKYGKEGTIRLSDKSDQEQLPFRYNPKESSICINGVTLRTFDRLTVQISVDQSSLQHHRLVTKLVQPAIAGLSVPPSAQPASQGVPATKIQGSHGM